jgi:hypothetical protein
LRIGSISYLVGGFNHLEKYESMGRIIPYIMENKKMFQTTNQISYHIDIYMCANECTARKPDVMVFGVIWSYTPLLEGETSLSLWLALVPG